MTVYVALLRNIGPVTHRTMPLGRLRDACAEAGLADVVNVGNTGNLVFASERSQAEVEAIVTKAIAGFSTASEVFTRTRRQVQMLLGCGLFAEAIADRPGRVAVSFFHRTPAWPEAYRDYAGPERMAMYSNHLIVDYGPGTGPSKLTIEKTVGARMTQRNWSSILRIAAKMGLGG